MPRSLPLGLLLLLLAPAACGTESPDPAAPEAGHAHPATFERFVAAVLEARTGGETERLRRLVHAAIPTREDLGAILRADDELAAAFVAAHDLAEASPDDPVVGDLADALFDPRNPERTAVLVHAATAAEIAAHVEGSVAWAEFPGGMRRFVPLVADPDRVFHVVERVAPGNEAGIKYSVFTRAPDGRWLFLAKPWRTLSRLGDR